MSICATNGRTVGRKFIIGIAAVFTRDYIEPTLFTKDYVEPTP